MNDEFKQAAVAGSRAGRRFVIVVDEAQNLIPRCWRRFGCFRISNSPAKLVQIILAGRPELAVN